MKTTGHTILVTGGASGIGLALAQSFLARGNRVIVAGRRQSACDEAVAANPGLSALTLDVASPDSIRSFVAELLEKHPTLDVVIHNAGIMRAEKLQEARLEDAEATIATNLLGPIR
ncbi:MAG: SDR family NAD(P)-dependent oxidoreductase, partial [Proteobacteria bacterium]